MRMRMRMRMRDDRLLKCVQQELKSGLKGQRQEPLYSFERTYHFETNDCCWCVGFLS